MSPSLKDLQTSFAAALTYKNGPEDCDIVSNHFSANQRVQIYRNNFIISLSEILQNTYPMVHALIGDECFIQVSRQHVLTTPLLEADVTHYGHGFSKTLTNFPLVIEAAPYIADVAEFEWQIDRSQQPPLNEQRDHHLPLSELSTVSAELHSNIKLHINENVTLFDSKFALFSLKSAIQNHQFDDLDIHAAECGFITSSFEGSVSTIALLRPVYELLKELQNETLLGDIKPYLLEYLNNVIELNLIDGFLILPDKQTNHA